MCFQAPYCAPHNRSNLSLRLEIEKLKSEKLVEEERIQLEVQETQKHLEEQRNNLRKVKEEQERTRINAQRELEELKKRIKQEQEEEKEKLESEMKKLLELKELHQKSVQDREMELMKEKEELSKKWKSEKEQIDQQRKEVLRLQEEFESYREDLRKIPPKEEVAEPTSEPKMGICGTEKLRTDELRNLLDVLEREYEDEVKNAHIQITQAKEAVKAAELETLQGKRGLIEGKTELQTQWKKLENIQTLHKNKQMELQKRIKEVVLNVEFRLITKIFTNPLLSSFFSIYSRLCLFISFKNGRKNIGKMTFEIGY